MKIQELFEGVDNSAIVDALFQTPEFKKFSKRFKVTSTARQHKNGTLVVETKSEVLKAPREFTINAKMQIAVRNVNSSIWAKIRTSVLSTSVENYVNALAYIDETFDEWLKKKKSTKGKDFSNINIHDLAEIKGQLNNKPYTEFHCDHNNLTSLVGLPLLSTDAILNANNNELVSPLEGVPKELKMFNVRHNKLTSFEGFPEKTIYIYAEYNPFKSFSDISKYVKECQTINLPAVKTGILSVFKIKNLQKITLYDVALSTEDKKLFELVEKIVNAHLKKGPSAMSACQTELMRNGLKEYAKL